MNSRETLLGALANPLSRIWLSVFSRADAATPNSLRILNFHATPRSTHATFRRFLQRLSETHFFITPGEAEALLENDRLPLSPPARRTPCLITFDDGFKSNYILAQEVLAPLQIRAIFFVCPGLISLDPASQEKAIAKNICLENSVPNNSNFEKELMSWDEIKILASTGHEIGSHSWGHQRLSMISPSDMEDEVSKAANNLESQLGRELQWFAFPFGTSSSINSAALSCIAKRHRFCRSGVRGLNVPKMSALGLLSEPIDLCTPPDYQLAVARGALDFRYRAARTELSSKLFLLQENEIATLE